MTRGGRKKDRDGPERRCLATGELVCAALADVFDEAGAIGDAKLEAEGEAEKVAGKVQNAVGSIKDTIRDA